MSGWFKDKEHLVRMASLFAVGIGAFLVLQYAFVPAGFGRYGHYRPGALDDNRDPAKHPVHYAGRAACEDCHGDVVEARKGSRHERIGCEACHGPLGQARVESDGRSSRPGRTRAPSASAATRPAPAKPKAFPQVVVAEHAARGPVHRCHKAHAPKIS